MLSPFEEQLRAAIVSRHQAMVEDLRAFVGMPTGPEGSGFAVQRNAIGKRLRALGATVEVYQPETRPAWLYSESGGEPASAGGGTNAAEPIEVWRSGDALAGGGAVRPVLLAGHLDTVHPASSSFRVFEIEAGGHRGKGPGCADMKGGLVSAVHALEVLAAAGVRIPWTFLLNSDEETGSFGSARVIRREARQVAESGGVGIALEPSMPDGSIVTERLGSGQFIIRAKGKAAHVGRDFSSGRSAVTALAHSVLCVAELTDVSRKVIANVGPIRGGATTNSVPASAEAWGNLRFPDRASAEQLVRELGLICGSSPFEGTSLEVQVAFARPAKPMSEGTERLASIVRDAGASLGQAIGFASTGGVCDGNLMQDEGLPTIDTLGVRGGGLHTTDEWVDLESLTDRCALLAITLLRSTLRGLPD